MHSTLNKIAVSKASNPHARFDLIVDISCARAWFMNNYFIKQLSYLTWYVCCHLALHGLAKCTCPSLKYFFSNLRKTPRRKFSSFHQSKIGILLKDSFFKINLEFFTFWSVFSSNELQTPFNHELHLLRWESVVFVNDKFNIAALCMSNMCKNLRSSLIQM